MFTGFGAVPLLHSITLTENAKPVIHAPRRVPGATTEGSKGGVGKNGETRCARENRGANQLGQFHGVVRKRNGDLRVCMDPEDLNKCIKRNILRFLRGMR